MTDRMESSDDHPQGSKQVADKKTLDTFFPSTWLLVLMVAVVLAFNIIVGIKVFSLQKEKAVIEILKTRYESYEKIIRDVEEHEERLRTLKQKIVPLEMRKVNAEKLLAESEERADKSKMDLNKQEADKAEIIEKLNAAQTTIAELSNDKNMLRKENKQLEKIVAELNINKERIEQQITVKSKQLIVIEENTVAAKVRLKDQQKYIKEVAAANSNFEDIRKQLVAFVTKMDETQSAAGEKINDLKKVIAGVAVEKDQLATQAINLTNEAKKFVQANAVIQEEIKGFQEQNKEYRTEVENVTTMSEHIKTVTETIKETVVSIKRDEILVRGNAKAINENLEHMATANQNLKEVITSFANQKDQLGIQAVNLTNEAKNIAQSNVAIQAGITGIQKHNKEYMSEIDKIVLTSTQMKSTTDAIKSSATNLEGNRVLIKEHAVTIKGNLGQISSTSQELEQSRKKLSEAVNGVVSQRENIDKYWQEIVELPDMKGQAIAFEKVLNKLEEVAQKFSENISVIQSSFDGKLSGMNLSFGTLEKDFKDLSLQVNGVEEVLGKIVSKTQKMKIESQGNSLVQ